MQPYLFLISVGPVQEFIATARRSRDLWFGSQLLSELSRAAALAVVGEPFRGALIFPAPAAVGSAGPLAGRNVANRILAELDGRNDPAELGRAMERGVRARLGALRDAAFARTVSWDGRRPELRALAEAQVEDLLELFWVSAPLDGPYPAVRDRLEALMAATKAARSFGPSPAAAFPELRQPKSSLDGSRESVIPEERYPGRDDRDVETRRRKADRLYQDYRAGRAERLSGVDLLKRRGEDRDGEADFPSTSHFAALPFLAREQARAATIAGAFDDYKAKLKTLGGNVEPLHKRFGKALPLGAHDSSILFEERLAEEVDKADLATARKHLADFFATATNGRRPEPYYALLAADGDGMGKAIDAQRSPDAHRALSQALDGFADNVRKIVEQHHLGALIYSGGDDVLAFLPLHTALLCAKELADDFRTRLAGFADADERALTLSVGIAVTHHIEPLADALRLARQAERDAKDVPGKDALAIAVSKRSGADRTVSGRWGGPFYDRLDRFIAWHRSGAVPDGAAYELLDLHTRLAGPPSDAPAGVLAAALAEEAVRVFKRKRGLRGDTAVTEASVAFVRAQLGLKPESKDGPQPPPQADQITVRALAEELIVAREFARALGELATSPGGR